MVMDVLLLPVFAVNALPLFGVGFTVTITGEDELPFTLVAFNMKVYVPATVRPVIVVTGDAGDVMTALDPAGAVEATHEADTEGAFGSLTLPVNVAVEVGNVIDWLLPALDTGGGITIAGFTVIVVVAVLEQGLSALLSHSNLRSVSCSCSLFLSC